MFASLVRVAALVVTPHGFGQDVDGYRQLAENLRWTGVYGWRDATESRSGGEEGDLRSGVSAGSETRAEPGLETRAELGSVRATAFRPPLYPLLLAALVGETGLASLAVGVLHVVIGVATVMLVWSLARRWGLGAWSSAAAVLVACDPILLNQSTRIMTETLAAFAAAAGLLVLTYLEQRPGVARALLAGGVLAIAALVRPTFLPWLGLCVAALLVEPSLRQRRWLCAAGLLAGAGLLLAPWAARNYVQFGRAKLTTTHGGYTVLLGNNPGYYRFLRGGESRDTWSAAELARAWTRRDVAPNAGDERWADLALSRQPRPAGARGTPGRSELDDDRLAYALARRYIREQPGMFLRACLTRLSRLWGLVPRRLSDDETLAHSLLRYAVGCWYAGLFALTALGAWTSRGRLLHPPWVWGLTLCVTFTAVHALYWTDMRMRAPLMPFICIVAAVGLKRTCGGRLASVSKLSLLLFVAAVLSGQVAAAAETVKAPVVEDVEFLARCDGTKQRYAILFPPDFRRDRTHHALIALHGHGSDRWQFIRDARDECRAARDAAAAHQLLFVSPDYRARTSWMGPKAEADVVQIVEELKEDYRIGKVLVCGGSMGGTGALTFAVLHPDLVDGVVSLNGTANLVDYDKFQDAIAAAYGGTREQVPDEYRHRSAEFFADRLRMPLALTAGGRDTVVPPDSVLRLAKAVQEMQPDVLLLLRAAGGHSTNYRDSRQALEFVIDRAGID